MYEMHVDYFWTHERRPNVFVAWQRRADIFTNFFFSHSLISNNCGKTLKLWENRIFLFIFIQFDEVFIFFYYFISIRYVFFFFCIIGKPCTEKVSDRRTGTMSIEDVNSTRIGTVETVFSSMLCHLTPRKLEPPIIATNMWTKCRKKKLK